MRPSGTPAPLTVIAQVNQTLDRPRALRGFAESSWERGCQTKMVLGLPCTHPTVLGLPDALLAAELLLTAFAFVGLTDDWARSVRLFHAMLGGTPHPLELLNTRPGLARDVSQPQRLDGIEETARPGLGDGGADGGDDGKWDQLAAQLDPVDAALVRAAQQLFEARCRCYNVD